MKVQRLFAESLVLRGNRCQCGACREYFNSTTAFDRHRVGPYGTVHKSGRRCLSVAEMQARGFGVNRAGLWTTRRMPILAFRVTPNTGEPQAGVARA